VSQQSGRSARVGSLVTWVCSWHITGKPLLRVQVVALIVRHAYLLMNWILLLRNLLSDSSDLLLIMVAMHFLPLMRLTVMCATTSSNDRALTEHVSRRPRLLATCGCWFLWDFSFYGNKVFQSAFIKILSPAGAGQFIS